jgi:hypothetical protein
MIEHYGKDVEKDGKEGQNRQIGGCTKKHGWVKIGGKSRPPKVIAAQLPPNLRKNGAPIRTRTWAP